MPKDKDESRQRKEIIKIHMYDWEKRILEMKMKDAGIENPKGKREGFVRDLILKGEVVNITINFSEINELLRLISNATNNINQVAKKANARGSVFELDLQSLQYEVENISEYVEQAVDKIYKKMNEIR